jgi:hypothetical protein
MGTISNIGQMIATRDLCKQIIADNGLNLAVYDVVHPVKHPNKELPAEFVVVKSIVQSDDGKPINAGTVEVCIYVASANSQPDVHRIGELTEMFVSGFKDASKNRVVFNDMRMTLVRDESIGYFYQSVVIDTVSINYELRITN